MAGAFLGCWLGTWQLDNITWKIIIIFTHKISTVGMEVDFVFDSLDLFFYETSKDLPSNFYHYNDSKYKSYTGLTGF